MPPALGAERPATGPPPLTGERTWPDIPSENYWFRRHLAVYGWVATQIASQGPGPLLDAGSGEGYGAAELAHSCAREVTAVELDPDTVRHVRDRYRRLQTLRANLVAMPFRAGVFAATVSLQVVEHIWDPLTYLRELARCTHGPIFLSTPNRPVHSPHLAPGQRPDNIFHVREFDEAELVELLHRADPLRSPQVLGLRHGPAITAWECDHGSLPRALLEDQPMATSFAYRLREDDFRIVPMVSDESARACHDLIVSWKIERG